MTIQEWVAWYWANLPYNVNPVWSAVAGITGQPVILAPADVPNPYKNTLSSALVIAAVVAAVVLLADRD